MKSTRKRTNQEKDKRGRQVQSLLEKARMAEKFPGSQARDGPVIRRVGTSLWGVGTKPGTHSVPIRRMRENKLLKLLVGMQRTRLERGSPHTGSPRGCWNKEVGRPPSVAG